MCSENPFAITILFLLMMYLLIRSLLVNILVSVPTVDFVHFENLCSRLQQRMYFLRRLRLFGVNSKL